MSNPRRRRCSHHVLQVVEFNALGVSTECIQCEGAIELTDEQVNDAYIPFIYTSPQGKDHDINILIQDSVIK